MNYPRIMTAAFSSMLCGVAFADASYQETTQQTGGSAAQIMGMGSLFSSGFGEAKKANSVIVVVQGNRMARVGTNATVIFDLDQETLTRVDNTKKQYSVATFEQLAQQSATAAAQAKVAMDQHKSDPSPQLPPELANNPASFDAKSTDTGATKDINGVATHEVILEEDMMFHQQSGGSDTLTYYFQNDVWLAKSEPPGWKEIQAFNMKLGTKMKFTGMNDLMQGLVAAHPGLGDGLKKLGEEQAKQQGVAVMTVQRLGGRGQGSSVASASGTSVLGSQGTSLASEVATNAATEAAQKEAAQVTSNGNSGILSSSLLNAAVGAFTRRAPSVTQSAVSSVSTPATPKSGSPASFDQVMMETTTVLSNFSTEPAPAAAFQVPANYQKLDWHEAMRRAQ
jgi:hypothetical protein